MLRELACLAKTLSATWIVAAVRLSPSVDVVVILQVLAQSKALRAIDALVLARGVVSGVVAQHAVLVRVNARATLV